MHRLERFAARTIGVWQQHYIAGLTDLDRHVADLAEIELHGCYLSRCRIIGRDGLFLVRSKKDRRTMILYAQNVAVIDLKSF